MAPQANFFEHIRQALLRDPDRVVVVWPASQGKGLITVFHTGQDVLGQVQGIREALVRSGVRPAEPVLLAVPVGMDMVCSLLALMALGAVPVLPPAGISPTGLVRLLRRAGIGAVVTQRVPGRAARCVGWLLGVRAVAIGQVTARPASRPSEPVSAEQPALISHSSGSTGAPKAIRRSHRVLLAQHRAIGAVFPPWAGQRDFPLFPNILLHNLAAGVLSILPDVAWGSPAPPPAARLVRQLEREKVQTLTGNVWYFTALVRQLRRHPVALPAVVGIGVGGSPVPEPLVRELQRHFPRAAVHIIYGASEAEPIAVREAGARPGNPLAGYCVGALHPALECRIAPLGTLARGPQAGQPVGEIEVRGAHVAAAPGQWLRTGDFGYLADGQLYLTGRRGNERLHQGVQHYQLEHLLYHLPGVARVAARADAAGFTLFVQGTATRGAIEELLAKNFPTCPRCTIAFRAHLPVDARHHSKILYDQLR